MSEKMFVLKENGDGTWEEYDDTYDITIHCRSQTEHDKVMSIIQKAASILKEKQKTRKGLITAITLYHI